MQRETKDHCPKVVDTICQGEILGILMIPPDCVVCQIQQKASVEISAPMLDPVRVDNHLRAAVI